MSEDLRADHAGAKRVGNVGVITTGGVVQCRHHLRRAPGLVRAEIGDEIRLHGAKRIVGQSRTGVYRAKRAGN